MDKKRLKVILELHKKWLDNDPDGVRANLYGADLRGADLREADLRRADLRGADLRRANLRSANLYVANLYGADLREADLREADLREANLRSANLDNIKTNGNTVFYHLQCPEVGAYTAFKKAGGKIVVLKIPEDAKRSSATSRKCRASKAVVLKIESIDGKKSFDSVASDRDANFIYEIGKTVEVPGFDDDRWKECSTGIHHFITRQEAVDYK